jgi:tripartite-type tricarboxylate transporter receptor subunit TctC
MWGKVSVSILAMILAANFFIQVAVGKEYPTKPIEIVCPYTPGSSVDILARLIADLAPKYLNQPMIVTTKPGAGGSIAAADVISSKPDGYKVVILSNAFFAITIKTQKVPFEQDDLVPLANFIEYKNGMAVKGDSPWKTLNDLLDYAKKNPGKLRWAHSGRGITTHLGGLLIFRKAGVETIDLPFKGSPEQIAAVLGGHVDAYCGPYGTAKDHAKAGKVRFLVMLSEKRYNDPGDVPCALELGFPEAANLKTYFGLYTHKNTPENIRKTLIDAFKKIYEEPEFKKGIEKLGEEPIFGGPEFLLEVIKKIEEVGVPVIKELGLYVGK